MDVGAESEGWAPCRKKVPNLGWVRWFDLSYYIAIVCYRNLWESIGNYNILWDFDLLPWFAFQYRAKIFEERIQDLWCITRFGLKGFCQCQWCCRILATARDSFAMFCIHCRSMFHPVGLSEKVPPSQDKTCKCMHMICCCICVLYIYIYSLSIDIFKYTYAYIH